MHEHVTLLPVAGAHEAPAASTVPRPPHARARTSLALGTARGVAPRGCFQATRAATTCPVLGRAPRLGQSTSRGGPSQGRTRRRPHQPSLVHSAPVLGRAWRWAGRGFTGGDDQSIWHEPWSPLGKLGDFLPFVHISELNYTLVDIVVHGAWCFDGLVTIIPAAIKDLLAALPLPLPSPCNIGYGWHWTPASSREYSTKS
ncbi:hypothetical protein PIB30_097832, partial [Stylosanthes scabra]|nr:hypothetical protein [Stylosanthes scabra]